MSVNSSENPSSPLENRQVSIWDTPTKLNDRHINISNFSESNSRQCSPTISNNAWNNNIDYADENNTRTDQRYDTYSNETN